MRTDTQILDYLSRSAKNNRGHYDAQIGRVVITFKNETRPLRELLEAAIDRDELVTAGQVADKLED